MKTGQSIKEIIQGLAGTGDELYAKVCEVISVDKENQTADVQPIDGSAPVDDVYLISDDNQGGVFMEPVVGSIICIVFVSKRIAMMVNSSTLKQFQIKIENTEFQMDVDGFLLKKANETLLKLIADLIATIRRMSFTTNTGSTIKLINDPEFIALDKRFKNFLK